MIMIVLSLEVINCEPANCVTETSWRAVKMMVQIIHISYRAESSPSADQGVLSGWKIVAEKSACKPLL